MQARNIMTALPYARARRKLPIYAPLMQSAACRRAKVSIYTLTRSNTRRREIKTSTYLLRNTVDRRHDVCRRQQWEHAGVDDAQVARPVHLELAVHDAAVRPGPHLAAARGVVQRRGVGPDEVLDGGVGRDVGAGQDLDGQQALDGVGLADRARELDGLDEQLHVERVAEEPRGRDGRVEGVVGRGAHAAARVRVLQAEHHDARVPDELHDGRVGGAQARVEHRLLLLVARDDLGRRVGREVLGAVLVRGRRGDGLARVGEVGQGQEQEEVAGRG